MPLRDRINLFAEDHAIVRRYWCLPCSAADREAEEAFLAAADQELRALPAGELTAGARLDLRLLQASIEHARAKLRQAADRERAVADWVPFAPVIIDLAAARRRLERPDGRAAAAALEALAGAAQAAAEERRPDPEAASPPDHVAALRALRLLERLREVLSYWHDFYAGYDPAFSWWVEHPYPKATAALEAYAKLLREDILGLAPDSEEEAPLVGEPIGRDGLLAELARSRIAHTPEELIAIGRREFAWCTAELERAAAELGFGTDWRAAVEHLKDQHVEPGEQPYLIRDLALEAIDFVATRELVTIPPLCRDLWRMEMMSPERQRITPYFTGGEVISVSYPTAGMDHDHKAMSLRGNAPAFCHATVQHELIPGHHLQLYMMPRHQPHRRLFRTAFLIEGWCLHWEMLLWDLGFARDAADRVGMLFWRLHRAARIVFSLRFHLGEWSPEECVEYLTHDVGHEEAGARAEVRRSIGEDYEPLYQCAYMIGGLQMRALYRELVGGGAMTTRAFHDAVLREGPIPIELIRCALTGTEPAELATWRFDEEG